MRGTNNDGGIDGDIRLGLGATDGKDGGGLLGGWFVI
jgi:hypothetical protein